MKFNLINAHGQTATHHGSQGISPQPGDCRRFRGRAPGGGRRFARIERLQDKTKNPAANLPVKVQPEARNIARREPGA